MSLYDRKHKEFEADASSQKGDDSVKVIATTMENYGTRMTILAKAGPIYITKEQVMDFFCLRRNE